MVLLALLSLGPMGYWSVRLFSDLRADIKELLPQHARSVETLKHLEQRFGGFSQLSMIVESGSPEANRRFSDDLTRALATSELVRSIRNKLGEEKQFFEERRHLFVDLDDLETILERVETAAHAGRVRANPLLVDLDEEPKERVKLDLSDFEKKYRAKFSLSARFPDGYFESPDRRRLAIILRKRGLAFDLDSNQKLVELVEKTVRTLDPKKYAPEMTIALGGDVKNVIEEHQSLVEDLELASAIVVLLLGLVVVAYYRRFRALYLVGIPVLIGCAWTFGITRFLIGYLNASSAFLGPIIPGNGMNFGLILLARYIEERRRGGSIEASIDLAVDYTAKATFLVALAASVAYGSLMATDFLGFKHFGIIGALGMVLCWLSTFVVMPPLIAWVERHWPLEASKELKLLRPGLLASLPSRIVELAPGAFAWGGVLSGIAALVLTALFLRDPLEKDFTKLRSKVSLDSGSAQVAAKVDEIFGLNQEAQAILAEGDEDVPAIVEHLRKVISDGGPLSPITDVTALTTLVPTAQLAKLEVLKKIREVMTDDLLANLEPEDRKLALRQRPPAGLATFTERDLPESVRADFRERDGHEGRVVLALPNLKLNLYHADEIERVAAVLRMISLPDGRQVESSGNFVIYSDMIRFVSHDGPRATTYSFFGVLILCWLAHRRFRRAAIVAASLVVGVAWLGAILQLCAIKINFLNFIALPITFGIGADYAVNIYTRYLLERRRYPAAQAAHAAIASTGGAVVLCSLTTIIGYASLLVARNGALISFGKIAILGELACLGAAIFVMPAWLMYWTDEPCS